MDFNNNSWESGVRFVEERKPKKFMRFLGLILIVFFSASIGGILGGYYVKKNYDNGYVYQEKSQENIKNLSQNNETADIPKNSINQVADAVGPAIVGVDNNVRTWGGGTALQGSGSGIIFDKSGYIVTNEHVIDGATNVTVTLPGGKKLPAKVIGSDIRTDLAVLKINATNLPVAKFGDSSKVRVGDTAIAIGNPLGEEFAGSVTAGVVSAVNRKLYLDGKVYRLIQTDASINPGNSGGALCNTAGEVIGINTLKNVDAEGMGFAIPINEAIPIIQSLMKNGYVSRPYIGIEYQFIDEDTAKENQVPIGGYVVRVVRDGAAEKAGILPGDIIVALDGANIDTSDSLTEILSKHKVGDVVTMKIYRSGRYQNVQIKLQDSNGR
ncbi:serine protease Do [Caloramator quimbayensis]|uniref:Serine protease Do n=1 Tax=Caloramator quimbayensis TaxID=1147123 RepID=A0A1T4Y0T5_9CLOT|nr:trypsin-like peptidase domain-containing protein [Caloramator quimbayensis]SKA95409.1 serine protease Do [Caloramator quimbayensis]